MNFMGCSERTAKTSVSDKMMRYAFKGISSREERSLEKMSNKHQDVEQKPVPDTRRKAIPLSMARGPQDYIPGQQEEPAVLTSLADMLQWAQNWTRSRSI